MKKIKKSPQVRSCDSDNTSPQWVLYILKCKDSTLYTGITNRLESRIDAHQKGKGARYTRGRGPLTLVYVEKCSDRSEALKRECVVKKLTRDEKFYLVNTQNLQIVKDVECRP